MNATQTWPVPAELVAAMQEAAAKAAAGVRDAEAMRQAIVSMDRISDEVRRKHGVLDIGVPAIRELRDE